MYNIYKMVRRGVDSMVENAQAVSSIADAMRPFLRAHERVFLCCFEGKGCLLSGCAGQAVEQLGGVAVYWATDRRWQGLLRQVFSQRATVLVGAPRLILGLAKIARATGTPLPVRHVVLLGQAEEPWLHKGIRDSLDAVIHTCDIALSAPCVANDPDPLLPQLDQRLLSWSSVLDFRAKRTEQGLRLEIIVFPGRKLPHLPSGASITVRPWRPAEDVPYCLPEG